MKIAIGLVSALLATGVLAAPVLKTPAPLRDEFNVKLTLDWKVVRPDPTHVSLKKTPGALTITTQAGSIHGKQQDDKEDGRAKNLHLLEIPFAKDADWMATTCVVGFEPNAAYQQAGLIVYNDDENYLKWDYEFDWASGSGQRFIAVSESAGVTTHVLPKENESGLKKYWVRITKKGTTFELAWSADGTKWVGGTSVERADFQPKRVGIIAKNGGLKETAARDATFEFFELRPVGPEKK